jgi:hypothetical protein
MSVMEITAVATKLFVFYVGGKMATSNVELHDMRFAIAGRLEDCYEDLRRQWWGTPDSLHIDCWSELTHADGYAITLRPEPFNGPERLFFANLGGYDPEQFTELHSNVFVVAPDREAAAKRSVSMIKQWKRAHRDTLFEVEHLLGLDDVAEAYGLHVHLTQVALEPPFAFTTACYIKIGSQASGSL